MSSYQVLARKWRPNKFSEVKGQDHIIQTLKNSILNNRIASGYIFSGSRGVGKTSVARLFAKSLCCEDIQEGAEPCNKCKSCLEIANNSAIDIQEIDGASNNSVDDVRNIRENIVYPPVSLKYKIYIIDEVHMLSTSAFNALLKTLEEPPAHGVFIFATTEPHKIISTVLSRCQSFDFKKLKVEDIVDTLKHIVINEKINVSEPAIYSIAREARGSLRDALSILDQVISFAGNNVDINEVKQILGFIDRSFVFEITKAIVSKNHKEAIVLSRRLFEEAYDVKKVVDMLVEIFRELLFIKYELEELLKSELPDYELKELREMSKLLSATDIEQLFYMVNSIAEDVMRSSNSVSLFEVGLLSLCNKPDNKSISELFLGLKNIDLSEKKNEEISKLKSTAKNIVTIKDVYNLLSKENEKLAELIINNITDAKIEGNSYFMNCNDSAIKDISNNQDWLKMIQDSLYKLTGKVLNIDIRCPNVMQREMSKKEREKKLLDREEVKLAIELLGASVKKVEIF